MSWGSEISWELSDSLKCEVHNPETKLVSLERQSAFYSELDAIQWLKNITFTIQKHPQEDSYFLVAKWTNKKDSILRVAFNNNKGLKELVDILRELLNTNKDRKLYISGSVNERKFMYQWWEIIAFDTRPSHYDESLQKELNNRYEEIARFINTLIPGTITYWNSVTASNPEKGCDSV